jgi:bla regulator protein BlaR1
MKKEPAAAAPAADLGIPKETNPKEFWSMKDRPFVADPDLVGHWTTVDFVRSPENFRPGQQQWTGDLTFLKEMTFNEDGGTAGPWRWTKGYIQHPDDKTEGRYWIRELNGTPYLFTEWISGDVTIRGEQPWFYVFRKDTQPAASANAVKPESEQQPVGSHAMKERPFVLDPALVGTWTSVDFVRKAEDFHPGEKQWKEDLRLKSMTFLNGGSTAGPWRWTKGYIQHPGDKTEGRYWIRELNGTPYLFMEWISGDVIVQGQQPRHFVFRKHAAGSNP